MIRTDSDATESRFSDGHDVCPPKTRADLDWDRVLGALADRTTGPMGRELALTLPFPPSHDATRTALAQSREATTLHQNGEPLTVTEAPDVRDALARLRVGAALGPAELRDVAKLLGTARSLRRFLNSRKSRCPALFAALSTDPTLDDLADEIGGSFDADGTLTDRASPRLKELRSEYHAARSRMLSRLDELMRKYEGIVQDHFVTEREGRYVIPIRSDAHERFPGLVHASSGSGATLFVEPRAVIPMGNRLKLLEAEVAREEIAIYTRLSSLLMDAHASVAAAGEAVALADVRSAVAKLAGDLRLTFPEIANEPRLNLIAARHPLLALDLPDVVPSDLTIASGHAMVVSGPNAGGKTVALKAMGLAVLMTRAGFPVPCAEGSTMGLFDVVLTDVGDEQSLQKNLSTFSAHVKNLVHVLEETRPGALVLLDELAGGTDPREGESLAAGILDSLCARGGAVVITTHYEGLKALALADTRFVNASVGFDLARLAPTYALAMGIPGSSSALAVARQYGMPSTVLERAERFLSREDQNFEAVVKKLNDERAALDLARQSFETREREVSALKARLESALNVARDRERQILSQETEQLLGRIRRAKEDLHAAQAKLRVKKVDELSLREAARAIERVAASVALGGELEAAVAPRDESVRDHVRVETLRRGSKVYVARLRADAEVVEVLANGSVRVAAGALKLVVNPDEVFAPTPVDEPAPPKKGAKGPAPSARGTASVDAPRGAEVAIQTSDNSVDLRGLRGDDAVSLAVSFLDRSLNAGRKVAFLVHGHGTGALRDVIRKELRESKYVATFRSGDGHEGGDGVTVVYLA